MAVRKIVEARDIANRTFRNNGKSLSKAADKQFGKGTLSHSGNFRFNHKGDDHDIDIQTEPVKMKDGNAKKIRVTDIHKNESIAEARSRSYNFKMGTDGVQILTLKNRFNYDQYQYKVDHDNKTIEKGSFKIGADKNYHNGAELDRVINKLQDSGYTLKESVNKETALDKVKHALDQFKSQVTVPAEEEENIKDYLQKHNISFMIDDHLDSNGKAGKNFTFKLKYPSKKSIDEEKTNKCCICGKEYNGYGNNAQPVKDGRCCDDCNRTEVIPGRIALIKTKTESVDRANIPAKEIAKPAKVKKQEEVTETLNGAEEKEYTVTATDEDNNTIVARVKASDEEKAKAQFIKIKNDHKYNVLGAQETTDEDRRKGIRALESAPVKKNCKKLTEGAGAGYTIKGSEYKVVTVNKLDILETSKISDGTIQFSFDTDVDMTADVYAESYDTDGAVEGAHIKVTNVSAILTSQDVDDINNLEDPSVVADIKNRIVSDLESMTTLSHQGGGWFHKTFKGELITNFEKDVNDISYLTVANVVMTDAEEIAFIDRAADTGNSFIQYSVFKDGDILDVFEDEDEAISYAVQQDADNVLASTFYTPYFGGDTESLEDNYTVWERD